MPAPHSKTTLYGLLPEDIEAIIAPDHEWNAETCGKGNCWQWNHNPQKYGLGPTSPPRCMFTQTFPFARCE